jgi:two-component system, LytTR family, sensor kinase
VRDLLDAQSSGGEYPADEAWPPGVWRVLAAIWGLFWLLMIVVAVQDGWDEPRIRWWQPLLWECSSALVLTGLVAGLLRCGALLRPLLATPWRWFWAQLRWFPLVSMLFVAVTYGLRHAVYALLGLRYEHGPWLNVWVYETIKLALFIGLWLGVLFGLHSFVAWRAQQVRLAAAQQALAEARLQQLRAQLQPHFLFNTLNAVSAFMHTDVARADRLLERLAELLRGSLALGERAQVPLVEELALLRAYVAIMEERFAPRVRVDWQIEAGTEQWPVPALLLQPLLENAFRHAVEPRRGMTGIVVAARRIDAVLEIRVRDRGDPADPPTGIATNGTGIGLRNCRDRLHALYGSRAHFEALAREDGWEVVVRIPRADR